MFFFLLASAESISPTTFTVVVSVLTAGLGGATGWLRHMIIQDRKELKAELVECQSDRKRLHKLFKEQREQTEQQGVTLKKVERHLEKMSGGYDSTSDL